jgi:hypothetical protein
VCGFTLWESPDAAAGPQACVTAPDISLLFPDAV